MGSSQSQQGPLNNPFQTTVPANKVRLCVAGFEPSYYTGHTRRILQHIGARYADRLETWYYLERRPAYEMYIAQTFAHIPFPEHLKGHSTSPFLWLEVADTDGRGVTTRMAIAGGNRVSELIGGDTEFCGWVQANTGPGKLFPSSDTDLAALVGRTASKLMDGMFMKGHPTAQTVPVVA